MQIGILNKNIATQVADLHISGISPGFISSLGPKFVIALYERIALSDYALGVVALENDKVLGIIQILENDELNIVLLTNDNYFSFTVLINFLKLRKNDIKFVVFSSALIGKRGPLASIKWSFANTGFRHTAFKLMIYGVFKILKLACKFLPFIPNKYSSYLWVQRNGLNYINAANVNAPEVVEQIRQINPDLIVSVSMNQIIKKDILDMPPYRCINVHCAPLPRYGGMSPYVWALANKEDHSAATIHYMDEGLDTGDILVQEKISVVEKDSAFALFYRCCSKAAELLQKVVDDIEKGQATSYPQNLDDKSYFSWPTKQCVRDLRNNGYRLARFKDFIQAIF